MSHGDEVEIPTYQDLMYWTLLGIEKLGGSAAIAELEEEVPVLAGVTDEQLAVEYPEGSSSEGVSKVINRLHWARTYLKKIGAINNGTRGIWSLTVDGRSILDLEFSEADARLKDADKRVRAEMRRAKLERAASSPEEGPEDADPDQEDESESWSDQLLAKLKSMDPYAFERLSMRLLREAGFRNVEVLGRSGDGGIDGVGVYKVSLVSFPTYFQCKRYSGSVSAGTVRDFRGAMTGRGEKGLVITTGVFTPAAKSEATRDGAPPIDLIDGDELCELLKQYGLGVSVVERIEHDIVVDVSFFDDV